jgi:hypothetical protein
MARSTKKTSLKKPAKKAAPRKSTSKKPASKKPAHKSPVSKKKATPGGKQKLTKAASAPARSATKPVRSANGKAKKQVGRNNQSFRRLNTQLPQKCDHRTPVRERRLKQIQPHKGGEQKPVGIHPVAQGHATFC